MSDIQQRLYDHVSEPITEFICGRFPGFELGPHDDIFALGFVNSLFAMELVLFIESTFGFTIGNADLKLDNFRTVTAMADLVARGTGKTRTSA